MTCKHWWYHAILVPICMYAFQTYSTLTDAFVTDVNEIYFLAPIVLVMAIFSYTIRTKIFDKIHGIDLSELSRVSLKGDVKTTSIDPIDAHQDEFDEDEDEDEAFMSH